MFLCPLTDTPVFLFLSPATACELGDCNRKLGSNGGGALWIRAHRRASKLIMLQACAGASTSGCPGQRDVDLPPHQRQSSRLYQREMSSHSYCKVPAQLKFSY